MKELSKEERDLLLKDLCAMLPYDLQVNVEGDNEPYVLLSVHPNKGIALIGINMGGVYATSKVKIDTIKSYLRPMSSMTEEERKEYNDIVKNTIDFIGCPKSDDVCFLSVLIDWLNKHHFDYRGLIPMGLAIDCTKLDIDIYDSSIRI